MSRFVFAVIALVLLLVALVVVAPALIPVDAYKGRLEAAASEALGRKVSIGDDLSFRLVPTTAFHVSDLEIANADGFSAPYLARVKSADIGVKLFPLLSKTVEVERFILTDPDIRLERARNGRVNWNIAEDMAGARAKPAAGPGKSGDVQGLSLGDVRITNGKASYSDAASGKKYQASDINAQARLQSMAEPLEVHGTMTFEGAPAKVDLVLTSLKKLADKQPANLKLDLTLAKTAAGTDLVLNTADGLSYSGPVSLNAPDLPALAKLLGAPLEDAPGFDKFSVKGAAQGGDGKVSLSDAAINFDAINAQGELALDWTGARPKATGRLSTPDLNLQPYLPPPTGDSATFPAWSDDKIDFGALRNIDADLTVSADKIELNGMTFSESRMRLRIDNGVLTATIPELGVYGGSGSGTLTVDARRSTPAIAGKFDVASVEAQPFSKDLLRIDRLLGIGGFKLNFTAQGASQAALMRSLNGSGGFEIADGAIKGVNLAKLARTVGALQKGGINPTTLASAISTAKSPAEQTDFSDFASQFGISNGLVKTTKISLVGPFLTMSGGGTVDLPAQKLDLRLTPKASTTADNKSGQTFSVPLRLTGTFAQPKLAVDIESLIGGGATDAVKGLFEGLGGKKEDDAPASGDKNGAASAVGAVLDAVSSGQSGDAAASKSAVDAINKLLKPKPAAEPAAAGPSDTKEEQTEPEKSPQ
ncbi:MAG: AsmA family protein [Alphaproteobacteria bacterium]|nr:AsmA family protein [Alphaproteobacteria bacterium]